MFIDTHCHLTDKYTGGAEAVIERATIAGVGGLICPTADPADISDALKIANTYNNVYCTIGIHPEYAPLNATEYLTESVLNNPKVIGIGEIGLDYHYNTDNQSQQISLFEQQLEIAKKFSLPVAIHTRDAEDATAAILTGTPGGVMHCFTSSWNLAKKMLDRGFFFSASGILTFKNAEDIRDVFRKIPLDRIVIETDSPYCAPVPYRGQVCEPSMVVETARVLAQIKDIDITELEHVLFQNVLHLFPKIKF